MSAKPIIALDADGVLLEVSFVSPPRGSSVRLLQRSVTPLNRSTANSRLRSAVDITSVFAIAMPV